METNMTSRYRRYWLITLLAMLAACAYPLFMVGRVTVEMLRYGVVPMERYPKYIIPYAPIALAVIAATALLPLLQKRIARFDLPAALAIALAVFFAAERLLETRVLVLARENEPVILESWQMSLCYVPPEYDQSRAWQAVNVLLGGYSPSFKLHFYLISVVLIGALLNSIYGFGRLLQSGDTRRRRALTVQTAAAVTFLGMCIWACFTSFYRTGELLVPAVSAVLMAVFFILIGATVGTFVGSFTLGRRPWLSVLLPATVAVLTTLLMYIGELSLLNGSLYRFGEGFFFAQLPVVRLAPVDIAIVLTAGGVTALIFALLGRAGRSAAGSGEQV